MMDVRIHFGPRICLHVMYTYLVLQLWRLIVMVPPMDTKDIDPGGTDG
jgi:hypothetical protein